LEGHTNTGLRAAFHPAGAPLVSNGWEHRLWLWDPVLGRPWLSLTAAPWPAFSHDGRIVASVEDTLATYRVDPALEYRSFAHASARLIRYGIASIRRDGRVLAVGTTQGVALWDLARGVELAFLPIGYAANIKIEASGDLLTSGSIGVWRWPVRLDPDRGESRIGPPRPLPLPARNDGIDEDRLWSVGSWRESLTIAGTRGLAFSPDGLLLVVQDTSAKIHLVEIATGCTLARIESPDLHDVAAATFSPDGSRLIVATNTGPAVHVWDLRAIRRRLAELGLDWDAPPYPEEDQAGPSAPALPPLRVDYGPLAGHIEHLSESHEATIRRCDERLVADPGDVEALHARGQARLRSQRTGEGIDDLTRAIRLRPDDAHLLADRGEAYSSLRHYDAAIDDLEASLARRPDQPDVRVRLARSCNERAWELVTGPEPGRDLGRALALSRRADALAPGDATTLNTLGVILYREGRYAEAIEPLERSLAASRGQYDGFDYFFLAMTHHRLGRRDEARACLVAACAGCTIGKACPTSRRRNWPTSGPRPRPC
jgi:tetratricopeptide (TPR) repeat protein